MIAGLTFYQILWYFMIYSFIGWCVEVVFCTVTQGKVVNRGFLNGPFCPIYGFGMVAVLMILKNVPHGRAGDFGVIALFLGCMALATAVELVGGWMLWKLFHARWWDYSDKPFNIGGFVCPEFSLLWGIGGVIVVRGVQPLVQKVSVNLIPEKYGWPVLALLSALLLADLIVTVATVRGLNKDLAELNKMQATLRRLSDALSEELGTTAMEADRRITEGRIQATLARAEARDALRSAKAQAVGAVQSAQNAAAGAVQSAQNAAAGAARSAQNAAAGAVQSAQNAAAGAVQSAQNAAAGAVQSAQNAAAGAVQSAQNAAAGAVQSAQNAAAGAVQSAQNAAAGAAQSAQNAAAQAADAAQGVRLQLRQLQKRAETLRNDVLQKRRFGGGRLLQAFPKMRHRDYEEILKELQEHLQNKQQNKR